MATRKRFGSTISPRGKRLRVGLELLEPRQLLAVAPFPSENLAVGPVVPFGDCCTLDHAHDAVGSQVADATVAPTGDNRIDSVLSGYKWGVTTITYSFYEGGSYYGSESSPTPVSAAVRDNVRAILSSIISPLVNLTFTEVADSSTSYGMIRYLCSSSPSYAYAYYPTGTDLAGDVVLNTSYDVAGSDTNYFRNGIGSHGFLALIHETCHALGLKHPGNYNGSGTGDAPYLPLAEDNGDNSLMSYNFYSGSKSASPMPYDLAALGYMYGAKTSTRSSDTTYTFTRADIYTTNDGASVGSTALKSKNTLWDGGGTDTVDVSGLPAAALGYRIDIGAGGWITPTSSYNSVLYDATAGSTTTFRTGTTYAATDFGTRIPLSGTTIENVKVSGSSDSIFVNSAANRIFGYSVGSSTGADKIINSDQADTLDLSQFLETSVSKSQVGNDLVLNLGGTTGSVTVQDYYAVALSSRILILYKVVLPPPTLAIAATSASKAEGTGGGSTSFTFTVTRSGDTTGASSVSWAVTGSGANAATANDFTGGTLPTGSVAFAIGEATKTITVSVAADSTIETDEGFTVTLSSPSGATLGSPATATGTIQNDDFPPTLAIAATSASKAEGTGGGSTSFTFTVTRSGDTTGTASVSWAVTGSGANAATANDFTGGTLPTGSVAFAIGEATKTITVSVAADSTIETDEGFTVTLSSPSGATLGSPATATGTIQNDDFPPTLAIAATSAIKPEGTGGGSTSFTFTVTRSGDTTGTSSVSWAVTGSGTNAANAADFTGGTLPTGSVTLAVGESTKTITVNVAADPTLESDEGFTVTLSSPVGATLGSPATATGTIQNDDSLPTLAIAATSAIKPEGTGGGSTAFTFMVTRSGDTTGTSSASWAVSGSGANAATATDFTGGTLPAGSVTFAVGEATKTITVNVAADSTIEKDEGFSVTLSSPSGATLGSPTTATGTIQNDDQPSLSITDALVIEGDSGTTNVTLQVTLSEQSLVPVTVSYAAVDGTAKLSDNDYVGTLGSLTFAVGETSKTITVVVKGDTKFEANETFAVQLSNPTGATIAKSAGTVTIENDDYRTLVGIAATDTDKFEGNSGRTPFTFTLARTGSLDGDVTVQWAVAGSGSKPADRFDFVGGVLPSGTVRIGAGRQSQAVIVNAFCDLVAEYDEGFTITVTSVAGSSVGKLEGKTTATGIVRNDDAGVPQPVAVVPAQSRAFAAIGVANTPSISSAIAMQGFAALNYSSVPTIVTIKRPTR